MAEDQDIRDPSNRQVYSTAKDAAANKGTLLDVDALPEVDVPDQFEDIADTGIRESILAGAQGQFTTNLDAIRQNALQTRRFRAGSTSERELGLARASRQQAIGALGEIELEARGQILGAKTAVGVQKLKGETDVSVATTGAGAQTTSATTAAGAHTTAAQTRADADRDVAASASQAAVIVQSMRSSTDEINADVSATASTKIAAINKASAGYVATINRSADLSVAEKHRAIALINVNGDLAVAEAQGDATVAAVKAQGVEARLNITRQGIMDIRNAITAGQQQRFTNEELSDHELLKIQKLGWQQRLTNQPFVTIEKRKAAVLESDSEAMQDIEDRKQTMNEMMSTFNVKATTAQMTGIWEVYGPNEIAAFESSMGLSAGDEGFATEYDFDNSGTVDFRDFVQFARYSELGGIPTVELRTLNESIRAFDINTAEGAKQFTDTIDEKARQFDLSQQQVKDLSLISLQTQIGIADAQLDLEGIRTIVDLLDGPAALSFTDDQLNEMLDWVTDSQAGLDLVKSIVGDEPWENVKLNVSGLTNHINENDDWRARFENESVTDNFERAKFIFQDEATSVEEKKFYLETFDIDGDGEISDMDAILYGLLD
jgi:hypothetical protein